MLSVLALVRIMFSAHNVHRRGRKLPDACCSFTLGWPSPPATKLLLCCHLIPEKITATIMWSLLTYWRLQNSWSSLLNKVYIYIQDSKLANKMGVNKDYRFLSCDAMFWWNILLPTSGQHRVTLLRDSSLQPQLGQCTTTHKSYTTHAKEILSTISTVYNQVFNLSLTLNYLMHNDSLIQCELTIKFPSVVLPQDVLHSNMQMGWGQTCRKHNQAREAHTGKLQQTGHTR
jgi:hypothetical protein